MSQIDSEPTATPFDPVPVLAAELNLPRSSVAAVVQLLAESATVPFIARYRKEATGGLDEVQIRNIEERRTYLVELDARRKSILSEIKSQGKLTPELEKQLTNARDQGRARRSVPAVQAQAPHARDHRQGARARAARRSDLGPSAGTARRAPARKLRQSPRRKCPT